MSIEIKVPQLPESVSDATLVAWHKKAGENVARDENLVDLETDKVVLEVPAPSSGVLKEIRVEQGTTVNEGDVLALLEEGESAPEAEDAGAAEDSDDSTGQAGQENKPPRARRRNLRRRSAAGRSRPAPRYAACWTSTISTRRWSQAAAGTAASPRPTYSIS